MFFILSKLLGLLALPSNLVVEIGLVGIVLLLTRFRRLASWLIVTSVVLTAVVGFSPLGNILMLPLEAALSALGSVARRARRHRRARRLDHAGNCGGARRRFRAQRGRRTHHCDGRARAQISQCPHHLHRRQCLAVRKRRRPKPPSRFASSSRSASRRIASRPKSSRATPIENAVFSRLIAQPKPGERWLLVTSAFHMPRAIARVSRRGFPGRGLSGRLSHPRSGATRRGCFRRSAYGIGADRPRDARMGRAFGLSADRQDPTILPGAVAPLSCRFRRRQPSRPINHTLGSNPRGGARGRSERRFLYRSFICGVGSLARCASSYGEGP